MKNLAIAVLFSLSALVATTGVTLADNWDHHHHWHHHHDDWDHHHHWDHHDHRWDHHHHHDM